MFYLTYDRFYMWFKDIFPLLLCLTVYVVISELLLQFIVNDHDKA